MTAAYWMLVPAYGAVWGAGRWYAGRHRPTAATLPILTGAVLVGGIAAEVLASGGFYLFSGRFADPNLSELLGRLGTYLPATLLQLAAYVAVGMLAQVALAKAPFQTRRAEANSND